MTEAHRPAEERSRAAERVFALRRDRFELEQEIVRTIVKAWPVGSKVLWIKSGRYPCGGHVLQHSHDRLFVENELTLKKSWITPYHIECASHD